MKNMFQETIELYLRTDAENTVAKVLTGSERI